MRAVSVGVEESDTSVVDAAVNVVSSGCGVITSGWETSAGRHTSVHVSVNIRFTSAVLLEDVAVLFAETSADSSTREGSVRAVDVRISQGWDTSVVHSADEVVSSSSTESSSDGGGLLDVSFALLSAVGDSVKVDGLVERKLVSSASGSDNLAVTVARITANVSSGERSVRAVSSWGRDGRVASVVDTALDVVSGSSDWVDVSRGDGRDQTAESLARRTVEAARVDNAVESGRARVLHEQAVVVAVRTALTSSSQTSVTAVNSVRGTVGFSDVEVVLMAAQSERSGSISVDGSSRLEFGAPFFASGLSGPVVGGGTDRRGEVRTAEFRASWDGITTADTSSRDGSVRAVNVRSEESRDTSVVDTALDGVRVVSGRHDSVTSGWEVGASGGTSGVVKVASGIHELSRAVLRHQLAVSVAIVSAADLSTSGTGVSAVNSLTSSVSSSQMVDTAADCGETVSADGVVVTVRNQSAPSQTILFVGPHVGQGTDSAGFPAVAVLSAVSAWWLDANTSSVSGSVRAVSVRIEERNTGVVDAAFDAVASSGEDIVGDREGGASSQTFRLGVVDVRLTGAVGLVHVAVLVAHVTADSSTRQRGVRAVNAGGGQGRDASVVDTASQSVTSGLTEDGTDVGGVQVGVTQLFAVGDTSVVDSRWDDSVTAKSIDHVAVWLTRISTADATSGDGSVRAVNSSISDGRVTGVVDTALDGVGPVGGVTWLQVDGAWGDTSREGDGASVHASGHVESHTSDSVGGWASLRDDTAVHFAVGAAGVTSGDTSMFAMNAVLCTLGNGDT